MSPLETGVKDMHAVRGEPSDHKGFVFQRLPHSHSMVHERRHPCQDPWWPARYHQMQRESKLLGPVARNKRKRQKDCLDMSIPWRKWAFLKKIAFVHYPDARTAIPEGGGRLVWVQRAAIPRRDWLFLTLLRNSTSFPHHLKGSRWQHEKHFLLRWHPRSDRNWKRASVYVITVSGLCSFVELHWRHNQPTLSTVKWGCGKSSPDREEDTGSGRRLPCSLDVSVDSDDIHLTSLAELAFRRRICTILPTPSASLEPKVYN